MLRLNSIMIGSRNPKVLGDFYEKVFGKKADWHQDSWYGWNFENFQFSIGMHSEVENSAKEPQRIILNIETEIVREEFGRIKETGAEVIKEPYEMEGGWIATFADPDGNYFQLVNPWKM